MKFPLAAIAFSAAWVTATVAEAQLALEWSAPPGCPEGDEVRAKLRELAGSSATASVPLRADGRVERVDTRYRLRLRVFDGDEVRERVIVSDSCADLAGAAAVALVFLLNDADSQGASGDRETSEPGRVTTGPDAPAPPEDEPTPPILTPGTEPEPDRPAGDWGALLQAPLVGLDLGPLPKPSSAIGLGAGLRYDAFLFVARGALNWRQSVAADVPRAGAVLRHATGTLIVCRGWTMNRVELSPCALLALEHLDARGTGADLDARSDSAFWLAPGAEFALHVHLSDGFALVSGISGRFEAARPRISIAGVGEVLQLGPFAFSGLVGAEWIL